MSSLLSLGGLTSHTSSSSKGLFVPGSHRGLLDLGRSTIQDHYRQDVQTQEGADSEEDVPEMRSGHGELHARSCVVLDNPSRQVNGQGLAYSREHEVKYTNFQSSPLRE